MFVPAGGEAGFSVYLGGSEVPARCPGLRVEERRKVYVGSTYNMRSVAGAELGWWINVCLSHDAQDRQRIGGPVTVTPPNGATFQTSHSFGRDCSEYRVDDCDVLYQFSALPPDLGTWRVEVDLVDPPERVEHEFELALPPSPTIIRLSSFLITGTPGSQVRIAAILGREECSRFGEPPDEVCYKEDDPHAESESWIPVWMTELVGPVVGQDGTAWWTAPAIDWPSVPDPEPGLPYAGNTKVCYAIILSGTPTNSPELSTCATW